MGHETHVRRPPAAGGDVAIDEHEWRAAVATDPDLVPRGPIEGGSFLVEWTGSPDVESVWIELRDGVLVVRGAEPAAVSKLGEIAARLGARVFAGSDGKPENEAKSPLRAGPGVSC